jgi:hypothetical protein
MGLMGLILLYSNNFVPLKWQHECVRVGAYVYGVCGVVWDLALFSIMMLSSPAFSRKKMAA